jgi:hypothetical protein
MPTSLIKAKTAAATCRAFLRMKGSTQEPFQNTEKPWQTCHVLWMLNEIETFSDVDKANRWLGFVQGCMACQGWATLDELRVMIIK